MGRCNCLDLACGALGYVHGWVFTDFKRCVYSPSCLLSLKYWLKLSDPPRCHSLALHAVSASTLCCPIRSFSQKEKWICIGRFCSFFSHYAHSHSVSAQGNGICGLLILIVHSICGQRTEENGCEREREQEKEKGIGGEKEETWCKRGR